MIGREPRCLRRRRIAYPLLLAALALSVTACQPTAQLLRSQRYKLLSDQLAQVDALGKALTATPVPEAVSQFSVFLPKETINETLALADELDFVERPPNLTPFRVVIHKVRTAFGVGSPYVMIDAEACTLPKQTGPKCGDLKVRLAATAFVSLAPDTDPNRPGPHALLTVDVMDVVPDVKVGVFQFALRGFVRDLVQAQLAQLVATHMPRVDVPLQAEQDVRLSAQEPQITIPGRPGSAIIATLRTPEISRHVILKWQPMVLPDGIHVFVTVA